MKTKEIIAKNIDREMKRQGVIQQKMADYTGISRSTLHKIIKQDNTFSIDFLIKAADYLNTDVFSLMSESGQKSMVMESQAAYNSKGINDRDINRLIEVLQQQLKQKDKQIDNYAEQNRQCSEQITMILKAKAGKSTK